MLFNGGGSAAAGGKKQVWVVCGVWIWFKLQQTSSRKLRPYESEWPPSSKEGIVSEDENNEAQVGSSSVHHQPSVYPLLGAPSPTTYLLSPTLS